MILPLGDDAKIDFTPKAGYRVSSVVIDGVSIGAQKDYTFVNLSSDHTVYVEYELNTPMIILACLAALLIVGAAVAVPLILKSRAKKQIAIGETPNKEEAESDLGDEEEQ